jgi:O-acetyl-ADP-ribose deacetylase (regulator of RNase III)
VYHNGNEGEAEQLASCYQTSLQLAEDREARSVSFPSISTGAYGYPMREAARIALDAVGRHLRDENNKVREVLLVLFDQGSYDVHARVAEATFGVPG